MCFLAARNLPPSTEHRRALVGSCERVAWYKYSINTAAFVHSVSIIAHDSSVLHKTRDLDHVEDDFLFPCSSIFKPWLVGWLWLQNGKLLLVHHKLGRGSEAHNSDWSELRWQQAWQ